MVVHRPVKANKPHECITSNNTKSYKNFVVQFSISDEVVEFKWQLELEKPLFDKMQLKFNCFPISWKEEGRKKTIFVKHRKPLENKFCCCAIQMTTKTSFMSNTVFFVVFLVLNLIACFSRNLTMLL